jgi:signal transduction histidine kinase
MIVYVPVIRRTWVVGYIGGAFAYQALFNDALAGQLQGSFAYRISDPQGEVIAVSADFPEHPASLVQRDVEIPGGSRWKLDVAVPPLQPLVARLATWTVGLLLVVVVVLLVLREEARARRFAAHSYDLELMSRDLLDANVRLEERSQQIAEANRAKSRFLANVSHELRTPLNAIVGYNSLAIDGIYGDAPPPLRSAHERIKAAAEHLLALVNDVLDLSKIEVGRMEVDCEVADVGALLDSVVTVIEPIAGVKGLSLHVVVARDLPRITTDARHVRQILLNLATNAVKFTERGSVTLSARRSDSTPDSGVTITVDDTGMGIAHDDLERIFEEFEQVRPSGRGDSLQRGTGLGLAISRKLARLLGGDIEVTSVPGRGSRFALHLPLHSPTVAADGDSRATAAPPTVGDASPAFGTPTTALGRTDSDEHAALGAPGTRAGLDDGGVGG